MEHEDKGGDARETSFGGALLLCAVTMSADAAAQTQMNVYFAANAMDERDRRSADGADAAGISAGAVAGDWADGERDLRALILGTTCRISSSARRPKRACG